MEHDRFNQATPISVDALIRSELNEFGRRICKKKAVRHRIGVETNRSDRTSESNRIVYPSDRFRPALFDQGYFGL